MREEGISLALIFNTKHNIRFQILRTVDRMDLATAESQVAGAWRGRGTGQGCRQHGHCSDCSTCDHQPVEAGDSSGSGLIGLQIVGAEEQGHQQALLPRPRPAPSSGHLPSPMFRSLPIMTCSASSAVTVHSTGPDNGRTT